MSRLPENPWATEQGRAARAELFRRLADGEGEMAEYAREVLAGRVAPRMLLYSSVLSEDAVSRMYRIVDQWHSLPEEQRAELVTNADARVRERIEALAEAAGERETPGPPDEDPPSGPVLRDAW